MIIKKYIVKDLNEIQGLLDQELGPNAIVLTTRPIKPKGFAALLGLRSSRIEVTAAIDEDELRAHQLAHGIKPEEEQSHKSKKMITAHLQDNLPSVKQLMGKLAEEETGQLQQENGDEGLLEASRGLLHRFNGKPEYAQVNNAIKGKEKSLISFLESKGIAHTIAKQIIAGVNRRLGINEIPEDEQKKTEFFNVLKREIAAIIKTSGPLMLKKGKPKLCALVGPTGVGKTTTIVKIALQYMQELNKNVALITLDTTQLGAFEYINVLAQKFGLPLARAESKETLMEAINGFDEADLILIDTCGRCQYQGHRVSELVDMLSDLDVETHLTLSATTKDMDIIGAIQQFGPLKIEGLIFTKLDETITHGVMVNTCLKTGMAISYLTNGQQIPGDLLIAHADEIAKSILLHNNAEEFDTVRQLANK